MWVIIRVGDMMHSLYQLRFWTLECSQIMLLILNMLESSERVWDRQHRCYKGLSSVNEQGDSRMGEQSNVLGEVIATVKQGYRAGRRGERSSSTNGAKNHGKLVPGCDAHELSC